MRASHKSARRANFSFMNIKVGQGCVLIIFFPLHVSRCVGHYARRERLNASGGRGGGEEGFVEKDARVWRPSPWQRLN